MNFIPNVIVQSQIHLDKRVRNTYRNFIHKREFGIQITNKNHSQENKSLKSLSRKSIRSRIKKNSINSKQKEKKEDKMEIQYQTVSTLMQQILGQQKYDQQMVASHSCEIHDYITSLDEQLNPLYLRNQKQVNEKMRKILIDWLVQVAQKFKLLDETLQLGIGLMDRYLQSCKIERKKYQLLGVTCLFMSAKYQQIYPPSPKNYIQVTERIYSQRQMLELQGKILKALNFNLSFTYASNYIKRYLRALNSTLKQVMLCKYLLQLTFMDVKFIQYKSNLLAASIIYAARHVLQIEPWPNVLAELSKLVLRNVNECSKQIILMLQQAPRVQQQAILKKYNEQSRLKVSSIVLSY